MTHVRSRLSFAILLVAAACGGGARDVRTGGGARGQVVEAPGPGAARYETRAASTDAVLGTGDRAAVDRGVRTAGTDAGMTLEPDGRLGLLAAWSADHLGEGGAPPSHEVVELFARHLGLVEPQPHFIVVGQLDAASLATSIHDSVLQFLARQRYDHFGGAVVTRDALTIAVVVLSSRSLELDPIDRAQPPHASIHLAGTLHSGFTQPVFAVTQPNGEVSRVPAGDGPRFDAHVPTSANGPYQVELLAQGPRGDTVVANFPLYVGVDPPTSVTLAPENTAGGDVASVEVDLARLLAQARSAEGRPALERTAQLDELARAHSRDMVEHHFVGHVSPTTGNTVDRVSRAGIRSGLVLENIGRGYGASAIHQGLLDSPGHRANIENADVTHVGIGVVAEAEGSRTAYVATEVFVRMAREIDLEGAPATVLALLNRARAARGAPPLDADTNLAQAAAHAAQQYFADPHLTSQDAVDDASAGLRRFSIQFRRVGGVMAVVNDVSEAGALEPALDATIRYVGIGVAQGTRPDTGPNAIAVVIVLGWAR